VTSQTARKHFVEQVLPYLDDAYSLARWLTGNATDAEDVVQEACLRALKALDAAPVENPRAWLLAVVRNTAFTWLAKNRPHAVVLAGGDEELQFRQETLNETAVPTPEETLIVRADRESVTAAIDALPIHFKEALVLREINGLSYREIAKAIGAPLGPVMSRRARARALMIDQLGARRD
jgi:RNA polymerase sigma factor (sigma-70 family)